MPPSPGDTSPSIGVHRRRHIYLDVHASPGTVGEIDPDVGLSKSDGAYGQDMIFATCNHGGTGYSVTFGHSSPGDCSGSRSSPVPSGTG